MSKVKPKVNSKSEEKWSKRDRHFMSLAFAEAQKARGKTLPNPAVGAVLVQKGKIIGRGFTQPSGQAHAEIMALRDAGPKAKGAILFVTLEPCSHFGRTPPCANAIIAAGISEVVVAIRDPNPKVGGQGLRNLRAAGIKVRLGLMEEYAAIWYAPFFFYIKHGRPQIILKIAQSLDGNINANPGQETAITGLEAQLFTHELRTNVDAVLIGGKTFRVDNPQLTPRLVKGPVPDALILSRGDHKDAWPITHYLLAGKREGRTVLLTPALKNTPQHAIHEVIPLKASAQILMQALETIFQSRGYHSILIEGGAEIWNLFLQTGHWDDLYLLTAPKFLPNGQCWHDKLAVDIGKHWVFDKFVPVGQDILLKIKNTRKH